MSPPPRKLEDIRADIDRIDRDLVRLINERAQHAKDAAHAKRARDGDDTPMYRPDREAQLLKRIAQINPGPVGNAELQRVLVEVISACRALELPLSVAFLGPAGTYTEAALLKHFGHGVTAVPQGTIDAVFREVESRSCDYGVVPVENSTEGVVNHTLDMFVASNLSICGEVMVPIHHCLMSSAPSLAAVERVYSHQQSFAQCRKWLDANLPGVDREPVSSNAEAARLASEDPRAAAVAGRVAADTYAVPLLAANIEDEPDNTTRFLVIGHDHVAASGDDKTSVMFWFRDRPGGLFQAIEVFATRGMNMTRIESRPSRLQRWTYVFYVDFVGHRNDADVREALEELARRTDFCKVIGSFPRAVVEEGT
jgi:chorismate mutase/prephenate dehydratase